MWRMWAKRCDVIFIALKSIGFFLFCVVNERGDMKDELRHFIKSEANLVCELKDKTPLYLEMLSNVVGNIC